MSGQVHTLTADGDTPEQIIYGPISLSLTGTIGGGTYQLKIKNPKGEWINVAGGSFTDVTDTVFDYPPRVKNIVKGNLSGSTSPDLDEWIQSD